MIESSEWTGWLSKLAARYRDAFDRPDEYPREYPREANPVAELGQLISANDPNGLSSAGVILEAEYWHQEMHGTKAKRTRADIWRKDPEMFVEVKLGYVYEKSQTTHGLGDNSSETLALYAYDVWRLLSLAARADKETDRTTECVFVVVAYAENKALLPEVSNGGNEWPILNAKTAYEKLCQVSKDTPFSGFLAAAGGEHVCAQILSGEVASPDTASSIHPEKHGKHPPRYVRCYAFRWVLKAPWDPGSSVEIYKPKQK